MPGTMPQADTEAPKRTEVAIREALARAAADGQVRYVAYRERDRQWVRTHGPKPWMRWAYVVDPEGGRAPLDQVTVWVDPQAPDDVALGRLITARGVA